MGTPQYGALDPLALIHDELIHDSTNNALREQGMADDAAVADYLKSFTNADAMAALHERSIEVEERQQILGRFGHTAESAFRDMYGNLDLEAWFSESCIAPETRVAIETWRGAAASLRPV